MALPLILAALGVVFIAVTVAALLAGQHLLRGYPQIVRVLPALAPGLIAVVFAVLAVLASALPKPGGLAARDTPVPCSRLISLRDLAGRMRTVTNPRTGQTVEYLVVGDGAKSNQVLVLFNGTSQILPDWPLQLITNSSTSPLIRATTAYAAGQDGPLSLCHDYRLLLFDYPGVGSSPDASNVTFDQISSDVDAMLTDLGRQYHLPTNDISVIGWSLGSVAALKYAFVAPAANPGRHIHSVVLIATKPGGAQSEQSDGHGAQCVDAPFDVLKGTAVSSELRLKLDSNNFKLIFPYRGQQPYNGLDSGCSIDINTTTETASLSVAPTDCGLGSECLKSATDWLVNRLTAPWSRTQGISQAVLLNQRDLKDDFDYSYCPTAGPNFTSQGCTSLASQPPKISAANGGVCKTSSPPGLPNEPTTSDCVPLQISGRVTVINGFEDLYIQHTYGAALVAGYQRQFGQQKANLVTYAGADGAGHGVLVQHPQWTQQQIFGALQPG